MSSLKPINLAKDVLYQLRERIRRQYLEAGEAGWGKPVPKPPRLSGLSTSKTFRVGVIGAGAQGLCQCQGMLAVKGIEIAGLADIDPTKLQRTAALLGLPENVRFTDAEKMLSELDPLDMVCVATTAPSHVELGRMALNWGAKRILIEKPIDNSLERARAFSLECQAAGVTLAINYSRRWMLDYSTIRRCIDKGYIGQPRSVAVTIGKGDLAMHGSHYFDLCRLILNSEPSWVTSHLDPIVEANPRGENFKDPSGFCLFVFQNGARAFIDFSSDLRIKDPFLSIKGDLGRIMVDEKRMVWTLQSRSQRIWDFPFAEPIKSSTLFSRVAADVLSDRPLAAGAVDGIAALEMILGAHLSNKRDHQPISFPLSKEDRSLILEFP